MLFDGAPLPAPTALIRPVSDAELLVRLNVGQFIALVCRCVVFVAF